jgi:hypothetical protein
MKIFNEELIKKITDKYLSGEKLTRSEQIFHNNTLHVRKSNISYEYSTDELFELYHCSSDIYYFIETYLNIKLHTYQKEIINHYIKHRQIIYMNSMQIGFNTLIAAIFLWESIFKKDIFIMITANKTLTHIEIMDKFKKHYLTLPYYMKPGIKKWTQKRILFDNDNYVFSETITSSPGIGYSLSRLFITEFAFIPDNLIINYYASMIPTLSALKNSKIIIASQPNGENFFQTLVDGSQFPSKHPDANLYELKRTFWWEVPGRDKKWKEEQIKKIGKERFKNYYDLKFVSIRSKKIRRIIEDFEDLEDLEDL